MQINDKKNHMLYWGDISRKQKCNCTMSLKIKSQISSKHAEELVAWRTTNNGLQITV
jgi:hypothetical protein